jgi:hypothetical protein
LTSLNEFHEFAVNLGLARINLLTCHPADPTKHSQPGGHHSVTKRGQSLRRNPQPPCIASRRPRSFDMEALCVAGFTTLEGTPEQPKFPPTNVMNDFVAGYCGAAGVQAALIRRAKEGGSYHVRVNLARCAMFFNSLGTFDTAEPGTGEQHQLLAPDTITAQTPTGSTSDWPRRCSSPKPSPTGATRF